MNIESPFNSSRFDRLEFGVFNLRCLRLFYEIGRYCHPTETKKSLRMFFRNLYWGKSSVDWFKQIAESPLLSALVKVERNFPEKLHRQILRTDYPIAKRLQILTAHYAVVEGLIAPELLRQALLGDGLLLSSIAIGEAHYYRLQLGYGIYPGKEGELSITMCDSKQRMLVRLSFSILPKPDGSVTVYIGGLQGANGENARDLVGEASKACHGLSPRRIAMEALFAFAKHLSAAEILGVSDKHHISSRKAAKHFSYDAYWQDFDAQPTADGDYQLPLVPVHKDYADTPRKRRAKYRRQHEVLDAVQADTLAVLTGRCDEVSRGDRNRVSFGGGSMGIGVSPISQVTDSLPGVGVRG